MHARLRVYPRAGGGTQRYSDWAYRDEGLSPRRRGNRHFDFPAPEPVGSIPAQAGEPGHSSPLLVSLRVYPRAGGGTGVGLNAGPLAEGLSPRRRGNRDDLAQDVPGHGSIPAQAGEPRPKCGTTAPCRVYPRAGGGTRFGKLDHARPQGLSPRRRGNRIRPLRTCLCVGSIPAQAGEPEHGGQLAFPFRVYPRAGGGTSIN